MADVEGALDQAGLTNPHVREYVRYWADLTGAESIEVVSASDDARLAEEALAAGELLPATTRTPPAPRSGRSSRRATRPTPASTTTGARRRR